MIRTQISLDSSVYQAARDEAQRCGISFAELVRRSLAHTLTSLQSDQPWARFAGAIEDGDCDASSSVDSVVYDRDNP